MPSLVTGIIGGIQGASAAHNAAKAQQQGYQQAGQTVNDAVKNANPILTAAANTAGTGVTDAAATAGAGVTSAAGGANALLNPYVNAGTTALDKLGTLAGGFSFDPSNLQNDPGYQFALAQGNKGINNSLAARGLGTSGAALKAAANYTTGVASTHYNDAYGRALSTYQTNVNSLMPLAGMGISAAGTSGSNLLNAAQYTGNTNLAGAQYAGNAGMWAGGQTASNLINAGVYTGNTQIGSGNAQAQGDIGAANSWNSMLGSIGQAGNMAFTAGFGADGGWSPGNIGTNMSKLFGASMYAGSPGAGKTGYAPPGYYGAPA